MILSRRFWIGIAAAVLTGACGEPIGGPSDVIVEPRPSPPSSLVTSVYRGTVVDEDDRPVANAKVTYHLSSQSQATVIETDAGGAFEISVESTSPAFGALPLSVEKPGHEPTQGWATRNCCDRVRLYRIREITAGDAITLTLFAGAYCGRDYEVPCRRVRVKSPVKGTLTLQAAPDDFKVLPEDSAPFFDGISSSLSVPVEAQSVTAIDVWDVGRVDDQGTAFSLVTSIQ